MRAESATRASRRDDESHDAVPSVKVAVVATTAAVANFPQWLMLKVNFSKPRCRASAAATPAVFLGAPVGVAAQPPDVIGTALPEADPDPTLVAAALAELPLPLPVPLDDVRVPPDDPLVVGVQHSSSAGPGQNPGVET